MLPDLVRKLPGPTSELADLIRELPTQDREHPELSWKPHPQPTHFAEPVTNSLNNNLILLMRAHQISHDLQSLHRVCHGIQQNPHRVKPRP